jgi:hypothetical protein
LFQVLHPQLFLILLVNHLINLFLAHLAFIYSERYLVFLAFDTLEYLFFDPFIRRVFFQISQLIHEVALHGHLLEILNQDRDKQVKKDELSNDQEGEKEKGRQKWLISLSIVKGIELHPAIVCKNNEN